MGRKEKPHTLLDSDHQLLDSIGIYQELGQQLASMFYRYLYINPCNKLHNLMFNCGTVEFMGGLLQSLHGFLPLVLGVTFLHPSTCGFRRFSSALDQETIQKALRMVDESSLGFDPIRYLLPTSVEHNPNVKTLVKI